METVGISGQWPLNQLIRVRQWHSDCLCEFEGGVFFACFFFIDRVSVCVYFLLLFVSSVVNIGMFICSETPK